MALAEARHFARAAEACNISQPALSTRIRRMEDALGTPLVERGRRFQGFTAAGARLLVRARQILADMDGLIQDAASGERLSGDIRVGVVPTATPLAGRLAAAMAAAHPSIRLSCRSLSSRAIAANLAEFSLEAGITYLNNEPIPDVFALPLIREDYCLVGSNSLIGNAGDVLDWARLADIPLALLTSDMQNRRILDRAFAAVGLAPTVTFEANSFLAIVGRAAVGSAAAILPRMMVDMLALGDLAIRPLAPLPLQPIIGLILPRREPLLPVAAALWSCAESKIAVAG
ncbi:LysR family transcriptional regulator [Stappia sp. F7233]|uniref:LysR family transcriptional regulator n=1 Tax=Stappia albiluteola TaxID=2758565 RepID=A0A839AJH8_9HYPH|nr:LysR family transcriptional regulator [Stappia albiluteola]